MSHSNERGASERGLRSSALWGTGSRGGESRSSVLWGKGGRGVVATCIAVCALVLPLAAVADPGKGSGAVQATFVAKSLLEKAKSNPGAKVDVVVQSSGGVSGAENAVKGLGPLSSVQRKLDIVGGVSVSLPAALVEKLQGVPGLTVTPDAAVKLADLGSPVSSSQLWAYESGANALWPYLYAYASYFKLPAIAVVDSGIENRSDFGSRIVANVNLSTLDGNTSLGDERGHGTFVAGIAAGAASDLAGVAPTAPIVSLKVMDSHGMAKTSDVIAAAQWILDNKDRYNIRVANFSLHSSYSTNFYRDPLDRAVERLWFAGVTVVAAAGNYGTADGASGVRYSPGNDPFVVTVGALDVGSTASASDDSVPYWSAYGSTNDGFMKPEVAAPGRYMVGPVPAASTIAAERPEKLVGTSRIQLSGTSFAAPVVAGAAALILALHPTWTPDQVKGALMKSARKMPSAALRGSGLGEVTILRALVTSDPPNPNLGLDRFVVPASDGSGSVFDALSWTDYAKANVSWDAVSWSSLSWTDLSWTDQSWSSLSWTDQSWSSLSWTDLSWTDLSWAESSREDAVEGEASSSTLAPPDAAALEPDPGTNVPVPAP